MQQGLGRQADGYCGNSHCCTDRFREYVARSGGRLTNERLSLLQAICDYGSHFTPEELQQHLMGNGLRMALTTIYRNLPPLEKAGIIRRTTFQEEKDRGATTYEHVWGRPHHDHLLCHVCGRTVEFQYDAIEVLQEEVARRHGFRLEAHHMELVGLCSECSGQSPDLDHSPEAYA